MSHRAMSTAARALTAMPPSSPRPNQPPSNRRPPELGRPRRVGADQKAAERRLRSGQLRGGAEQRRHRAGPGGGGADTGDAGVGVDLDEGEVLVEAAADDADVGDLHGRGRTGWRLKRSEQRGRR